MTETPVKAELAPLAPGMLSLIREPFTVQSLADKLTAPVPAPEESDEPQIPFPDLPKPVELTDGARTALALLPSIFGKVTMAERRMLSDDELTAAAQEDVVLTEVMDAAKKQREYVREIIRHHMDVTAQEGGEAWPRRRRPGGSRVIEATPRDQNGHYLMATKGKPFIQAIRGFVKGFEQRFVSGKTKQSIELLQKLQLEGKITRKEYLACTSEVRVLDEDKIKKFLASEGNTARGLQILRDITVRDNPSSTLYGPSK